MHQFMATYLRDGQLHKYTLSNVAGITGITARTRVFSPMRSTAPDITLPPSMDPAGTLAHYIAGGHVRYTEDNQVIY
jgi:hypothetical protein